MSAIGLDLRRVSWQDTYIWLEDIKAFEPGEQARLFSEGIQTESEKEQAIEPSITALGALELSSPFANSLQKRAPRPL